MCVEKLNEFGAGFMEKQHPSRPSGWMCLPSGNSLFEIPPPIRNLLLRTAREKSYAFDLMADEESELSG
jgi:hypothetical protein